MVVSLVERLTTIWWSFAIGSGNLKKRITLMPLRIIQVGLGGWGRGWARTVISLNEDVETVAYVDMIESMRTQAQNDLNLPSNLFYPTLEEALTAVDCDAVIITANLPGHVPTALTALKAGKHVLME